MIALSIRQPWAWLILNAGKDIENRDWPTSRRERILIQAGKGMTRDEYAGALDTIDYAGRTDIILPAFDALERGGIVGSVDLVDCVQESESKWFFGRYGFVLRNPEPLPFVPYKGQLGFFEIPMCEACGGAAGFHGVMCMRDTDPPPFGAMHS